MVIGIEADAAGIGIMAFIFSVRYRSIPVPDWVSLSSIGTSFHSSTELTRCGQSGNQKFL
jgi:hypothetical protein